MQRAYPVADGEAAKYSTAMGVHRGWGRSEERSLRRVSRRGAGALRAFGASSGITVILASRAASTKAFLAKAPPRGFSIAVKQRASAR